MDTKWSLPEVASRPVFIVGCGRSGTTLFYNLLAGHPALGWFSNYENRFPRVPFLATANHLYARPVPGFWRAWRRLPRPSEAYRIWDELEPRHRGLDSPPLTEAEAAGVDPSWFCARMGQTVRTMRARHFLNKNTRNTRRMRYLHALFPKARFVHVIRDGRAVAHSLLRVPFWKDLKLWWANGMTPGELSASGVPEVLAASRLWKYEVSQARYDAAFIPAGQYLEVRYDALCRQPTDVLRTILEFCGLDSMPSFESHVSRFEIRETGSAWRSNLSRDQHEQVEQEIGDLLGLVGYV